MTSDEIKEMFKINSDIRKMSVLDIRREDLENRLNSLFNRYMNEHVDADSERPPSKSEQTISLDQAFGVMFDTCKKATEYELTFKPGDMTENDIKMTAGVRNMALQKIISVLNNC